jgi:hypothetical protein
VSPAKNKIMLYKGISAITQSFKVLANLIEKEDFLTFS